MRTNGDPPVLGRLLGTVGEAMISPVLVLDADTPADRAARQLEERGVSAAPVLHHGRVVGVVTLSDLVARSLPGLPVAGLGGQFPRHQRLLASLRAWQLMRAGPVVAAGQPLVEAAKLLEEHRVLVLPVVDSHGRPVGIIARDDVIAALARHARPQHVSP